MASEASIIGCALANQNLIEFQSAGELLIAGLKSGKFVPKIDRKFKLSEASKAHEYIMDPTKKSKGKVILLPDCVQE